MKKYIVSVFVNLLLWIFITMSFFVIALLSNKLELTKALPEKITNVIKFFDGTFVVALIVGAALMFLFLKTLDRLFLKLRKKFPKWAQPNSDVISNREFANHFQQEVLGQINNVANLSFLASILYILDRARVGSKILQPSIIDPINLLEFSGLLYIFSFILFWLSSDSETSI